MDDTTSIRVIQFETKNDTTSIWVDKKIVEQYTVEKPIETIHVLAIVMPVVAALLTLILTRLFDSFKEKKKHKRELKKESRIQRINILKSLNELKTDLHKSHFPNPGLEDYYIYAADRMISANPFHDLIINCDILFDSEIIDLSYKLYNNAERIKLNFDWRNREQPSSNIALGKEILYDINILIQKITKNINNE